jgi:hypothetical protein
MTGLLEKFEDTKTKGAIRSRKSEDDVRIAYIGVKAFGLTVRSSDLSLEMAGFM